MKKKMMTIVTLVTVATLATASLTGCGTQANAIDDVIISEENLDDTTIVVTDNATTESSTSDTNEITSTEVIGETDTGAFTGAEDENIVLYDEAGKRKYLLEEINFLPSDGNVIVTTTEIPVYSIEGKQVGHIKTGATITLSVHGENSAWSGFENPVAGTEYDYLYVFDNDLPTEETPMMSAEDVKDKIIFEMNNRSYDLPTILNTPDSDMEVFECRIYREDNPGSFSVRFHNAFYESEINPLAAYMTYYVECEEDGDFVICKVYYKDHYDDTHN